MVSNRHRQKTGGDRESDSLINEEISRRLKAMYREVESEAIPERFLDLLEQLDQAEKSQTGEQDK